MVYIFPIILTLFLMYHYDYREHKEGRKAWYIFLLVYCILVAGLRYRLGNDTINYAWRYNSCPDIFGYFDYDFSDEKYGRGYMFLTSIARTISDNFLALQIILAIIVNIVYFRFFYKNSAKIFTCVLFYFIYCFFNLNMEVLRESCAISVFLLSWESFWKHKWWKYYLFCSVAVLFHVSAAFTFLLPIFTLNCFRKAFTASWLSLGVAIGLFILGNILLANFFDTIKLIEIGTMEDYASSYENSRFGQAKNLNIIGLSVFVIFYVSMPMVAAYLVSNKSAINKGNIWKNEWYVNSIQIMVIMEIYIASMANSIIILGRFNNYLIFFLILIYSDVIFHRFRLSKNIYKLSFGIWMILLSPLFYLRISNYYAPIGLSETPEIRKYYPYYSVLNPQRDRERESLFFFNLAGQ